MNKTSLPLFFSSRSLAGTRVCFRSRLEKESISPFSFFSSLFFFLSRLTLEAWRARRRGGGGGWTQIFPLFFPFSFFSFPLLFFYLRWCETLGQGVREGSTDWSTTLPPPSFSFSLFFLFPFSLQWMRKSGTASREYINRQDISI